MTDLPISIERTGARIRISGSCVITRDPAGLANLGAILQRLTEISIAPPAFPTTFKPFADADQSIQIGELTLENASDGMFLSGAANMVAGSHALGTLISVLTAAQRYLETSPPARPAAPSALTLTPNPFQG